MTELSRQSPVDASTPSSTAPTNNQSENGIKAAKDKACPFCNQPFTSSSLGRHLDLYIKPKNPKPQDGIHDVEKIRLMRGGITRRQPRSSLKGKQGSEIGSDRGTPSGGPRTWYDKESKARASEGPSSLRRVTADERDSGMDSPVNTGGAMKTFLNTVNWQATGVINNIPPKDGDEHAADVSARQTPRSEHFPTLSNRRRGSTEKSEHDALTKMNEESEIGKAAQLALREVLDSLEAARSRASPASLFEFDFYSMTFSSLCLHILSPPPTLFSSTPFATNDSWSLTPPTAHQFDALQQKLRSLIQTHTPRIANTEILRMHQHLQDAWNAWSRMQESERIEVWRLETLRAYARASQKVQEKHGELDLCKQQIEHLRQQYDLLSRCQLPRDLLLHPPNTLPIRTELSQELMSGTPESRSWDYDRLIYKWRGTLRDGKARHPVGISERLGNQRASSTPFSPRMQVRPPSATHPPPPPFETRNGQASFLNGLEKAAQWPANGGDHVMEDDEDADADADAEGEEMSETGNTPYATQQVWPQQPIVNGQHQHSLINENGKRRNTPLSPELRHKGYKVYHES